jgi:hypothetical protein
MVVFCAVVVLAGSLFGAACGSDDEAKAALSAALDKGDVAVAKFQTMGADSTVADIKAARDEVAPLWQEVVAAAKDVKDADVAAAEKAWTDLDQAVSSLADDANIMEAAGVVLAPVQALLKAETDLRRWCRRRSERRARGRMGGRAA